MSIERLMIPDGSLEYAQQTVAGGMKVITDLVLAHEIVVSYKPDGSPLTNGDEKINEHFYRSYPVVSGVEIRSEEGSPESDSEPNGVEYPNPTESLVIVDLDPLDNTVGFAKTYKPWLELPEGARPPLPVSSGMISAGGRRPMEADPIWGVVGAPFLPDGPRIYAAKRDSTVLRLDMASGVERELSIEPIDSNTQQVILASARTAEKYGKRLAQASFKVVGGIGGVASPLSVLDEDIFRQLRPEVLAEGDRIVGNVMGGYDWDVAAMLRFYKSMGAMATGLTGQARTLGKAERGGLFAATQDIHERLLWAVN